MSLRAIYIVNFKLLLPRIKKELLLLLLHICLENLKEFLGHARGISPTLNDFVSCFYIEENRRLDADALDFLKHLVAHVKSVAEDTPTSQASEEL